MNSASLLRQGRAWRWAWLGTVTMVLTVRAWAGNVQTNWVEKWITNTVQVQMQANRFVTEFHTNWLHHVETNILDLYLTNHVTRTLTNSVQVYATNYVTRTMTNTLFVELVQTNFQRAYRTNVQTLNLTNWSTVLLFKTNWVNQPVTNVVEIEMARQSAAEPKPAELAQPAEPQTESAPEPLAIQASRSARTTVNNQVEVALSVKWADNPDAPLRVQQWRIERADGSILSFGDEREFKRPLPVGVYRIQVRVQRDSRDTPTIGRGTLTITQHEVLVAQKPSLKRSST